MARKIEKLLKRNFTPNEKPKKGVDPTPELAQPKWEWKHPKPALFSLATDSSISSALDIVRWVTKVESGAYQLRASLWGSCIDASRDLTLKPFLNPNS